MLTGLVDAVSVLSLGRVFVANMTGNVVFVGFALAGAPGFALWASLTALVGFVVGASLSVAIVGRYGAGPRRLLAVATMLLGGGGLFGALIVPHVSVPVALGLVTLLLTAVALAARPA